MQESNFQLLAKYNQWVNNTIYEALSNLKKQDSAVFEKVMRTLNHLLLGDIVWLKRFADHLPELSSLDYVRELEKPKSLGEMIYHDINALKDARVKLDQTILDFSNELSTDHLNSSFSYKNMKGDVFTKNFGFVLQHFFNHQTHHRGQLTILFQQADVTLDVTDLLFAIPDV